MHKRARKVLTGFLVILSFGLGTTWASEALETRESVQPEIRQALLDLYSYATARGNHVVIPGSDVRVILGKIIPNIDEYFQVLIENLESIEMTQGEGRQEGRLIVEVHLATDELIYKIRDRAQVKTGQPYAVRLGQRSHFEAYMRKDNIIIDAIAGISILTKLPVVSDSVYPKKLLMENSKEKLTIWARAASGVVDLVATADVRGRKFDGVDWLSTLFTNLPVLFGGILFKLIGWLV